MKGNSTPQPPFFKGAKVHCVGITGVGMCALAQLLRSRGLIVSGSDVAEEFHTNSVLRHLGILVLPFRAENITNELSAVIYSSAYTEHHTERQAALSLGVPQYAYAEALGMFFPQGRGLLVSGTHGKTTTTALLGRVWEEAKKDPTVIVGGVVRDWGGGARIGRSAWMIIEGDEYQEKFLHTVPETLVLSSLDYDHPDYFPDRQSYRAAFQKLADRMGRKGTVITHTETASELLKGWKAKRQGPQLRFPDAAARAFLTQCRPALFGGHNEANMLLVVTAAHHYGLPDAATRFALEHFGGVARRLERYTPDGASLTVFDDYAHHPEEVRATLAAIRQRLPGRPIVLVFHPHTFSRTKALFEDFVHALSEADYVFVLEIYASQREEKGDVSAAGLAQRVAGKRQPARYVPDIAQAIAALEEFLPQVSRPVLVTMGAGDVWKVARAIGGKNYE